MSRLVALVRTLLRRLLRFSGWLLAAIVLLLVVVAAAVGWATQTDGGRAFVLARVVDVLNTSVFAGTVRAGRLEGPIFGALALVDVEVRDAGGGTPVRFDRLGVRYGLRPLLDGQIRVSEVELSGLRVAGRLGADGSLDLAGLLRPSEPTPPPTSYPDVDVASIRLRDVSLSLSGIGGAAEPLVVDGMELDGSVRLHTDLTIDASLARWVANVSGPPVGEPVGVTLTGLSVRLGPHGTTAGLAGLRVGASGLTDLRVSMIAAADGVLPWSSLDAALGELRVDPADVARIAPEVRLRAPVLVGLSVSGPPAATQARVDIRSGDASVAIDASADLGDPARPGYRVEVSTARLRPSAVLDDPRLDALDADLSLRVRATGRGMDPKTMRARLAVDVGPSRAAGFGIEALRLVADWSEERLTLHELDATASGVELEASGTGTLQGEVRLKLDAHVTDAALVAAVVQPELAVGGELRVGVEVDGRVPLESLGENRPTDPLALAALVVESVGFRVDVSGRALRWDRFRVGALTIRGSGERSLPARAKLDLTAREIRVPGIELRSLAMRSRLDGTALGLDVDVVQSGDRNAGVEMVARLEDRLATLELSRLRLLWDGVPVELESPARASASFSEALSPLSASVSGLALRIGEARFDAEGSWNHNGAVQGAVTLHALDLSLLKPAVPALAPLVGGTLSATVRASGNLRSPTVGVTVQAEDVRWGGYPVVDLQVVSGLDGGQVFTADVDVALGKAPLLRWDARLPVRVDTSRGRYAMRREDPFSFRLEVPTFDLQRIATFVSGLPVQLYGAFSLRAEGSGTLERPAATVGASLAGVVVDLGGGRVVDPFTFDTEVRYTIDGAGVPDGGLVSTLVWRDRERLRVDATWGADLRRLYDGRMQFDALLEGAHVDLRLAMAEFPVSDLPPWIPGLASLRDGTIAAEVGWKADRHHDTVDIRLDARRVTWGSFEPVDLSVRMRGDEAIRVGASADWGGRRVLDLQASAASPVRRLVVEGVPRDLGVTLQAGVATTAFADLASASPALAEVPGTVGGSLVVTGTAAEPRITGRFAARDLRLFDGRLGLIGVELSYARKNARLDIFSCDPDGTAMTAEATVDLPFDPWAVVMEGAAMPSIDTWPLRVDIGLEGSRLASLLPPFALAGVVDNVSGEVDGGLRVSGTLGNPRVEGALSMKGARLSILPLGRRFDDVTLQMSFDNRRIAIERLFVKDGNGTLRGDLTVRLDAFRPTELSGKLELDEFLLAAPSGAGAYVKGIVAMSGETRKGIFEVDTEIRNLTISVPDDIGGGSYGATSVGPDVFFVGETVPEEEVGKRTPLRIGQGGKAVEAEQPFDMNVVVRTTGTNRVRHTLADVKFAIDLRVELRRNDVVPSGTVTLPEGEVRFLGKTFVLKRGLITFDKVGENPFDPLLDIRAEHLLSPQVQEAVAAVYDQPSGEKAAVVVAVTGTGSKPKVELLSDPSMTDEDVIFTLLTGRPRTGSDADAGAAGTALAAAGSLFLGYLSDRLSDDIFVDTLRIEGDAQSGQAIARVEGGKYLRDDLYISGTYIPGAAEEENDFEVALEWILGRLLGGSLRFEVRAGNAARGGIELLYNYIVQ